MTFFGLAMLGLGTAVLVACVVVSVVDVVHQIRLWNQR